MCPRDSAPWSTRRGFIASALVAGSGLAISRSVLAQDAADATDTPAETITSPTKEEYRKEIEEAFNYSAVATPGGTFLDSNVNDVKTIHPLLADDADSLGVAGLFYEGLFGSDIRTGQPVPTGLADYWEISPDRRTYTFHLNQDARWHDGVPVTAEDVQFSFDAVANPELASAYSQTMMEATESWRAIDEHTFEVVAKEPLATFLFDLHAIVIPKHIWESVPIAEWRTDGGATGQDPSRVIGSGRFKFEEWRQGESITAVRNDDYYQKPVNIDRYVVQIWPDQTSVVNAFLNGDLDVASLQPSDVETVRATEGLTVATYPTRGFTFYMTNLDPEKSELFLDKRVRQALFYGLDRESIVNDILLGNAEVAYGTQPVISFAYAPDRIKTRYDFDPEKAQALLAEAGWVDDDGDGILEKDGRPFAVEFLYGSGSPTSDQIVAYLQDAWKAIGIDATPRSVEFSSLVQTISEDHDFEMALLGFGWDPSFIQDAMFGCDQYEGGFNMVRYCNERVDELNAQAKRTFDEDARRELVIEATNIVNDDLPVAVMHFSKANLGYNDRLQNYNPSSWGLKFEYVWIQQ